MVPDAASEFTFTQTAYTAADGTFSATVSIPLSAAG